MTRRIANLVVLVEDREQQNLVRRYLQRCNIDDRNCRYQKAPPGSGSGENFVRDQYAAEVRACRARGSRAAALLIVMIDADRKSTADRHRQLEAALSQAEPPLQPREPSEPIVLLIPRRHVETWIRALRGQAVDEATDYTRAPHPPPTSADIRQAATTLYEWTRPGAEPAATSPPSLTDSLSEWRRIG